MNEYTNAALDLHRAYQQVQERNRLELAAARVFDRALAAKRGGVNRVGKNGRLMRQISTVAVMNAVNTEGREVLKDAQYWKDQDRREFGITDGARSVVAMKNRMGRVSYRKIYGKHGTSEHRTSNIEHRTSNEERHTSMENKNITVMVN